MGIVERLREHNEPPFDYIAHEAADEIERLRNAITVQANAVRVLLEAETSELNLLRKNAQEAYTAKATLDSEREANEILTDEIERLRGMLISALDGLDEYWVTFPEGVELVNQIKALQQKEKE
jgi:hypothetical protein